MSQLTIKYDAHGNRQFTLNGKPATQAEVDAVIPPKPFGAPMTTMAWDSSRPPKTSRTAAVPAHQAAGLRKFLEERKVQGVHIDDGGHPHFRTRQAKNDYLKARGMVDFEGGFGDHTRNEA